MKNTTNSLLTLTCLVAAALFTSQTAPAQGKDDDRSTPEKKYVVRVLTIENGDTTVSDHPIDADSPEFSWVADDGTEFTAMLEDDDADMREDMTIEVLGKEKYNEFALKSGKDGSTKHVFIKKMGRHGDRDCCGGGNCCRMDMKELHGKTGDHEMMRMHKKMDKDEMMRMHEKMQKKMWKEKKSGDDDEEDDDSDADTDDDDGNLP